MRLWSIASPAVWSQARRRSCRRCSVSSQRFCPTRWTWTAASKHCSPRWPIISSFVWPSAELHRSRFSTRTPTKTLNSNTVSVCTMETRRSRACNQTWTCVRSYPLVCRSEFGFCKFCNKICYFLYILPLVINCSGALKMVTESMLRLRAYQEPAASLRYKPWNGLKCSKLNAKNG